MFRTSARPRSVERRTTLIALPFVLVVRGSVSAHTLLDTRGWLSIGPGALPAAIRVAIWGTWLWRQLTGRDRFREIARNVALPLVAVFCVYSLG